MKLQRFKAAIELIGINPFVAVPEEILQELFRQAGKEKGYIPVSGSVNGKGYRQTLVRYSGSWRLYINTTMLTRSPKRIGEIIQVTVRYDGVDRTQAPHPDFAKALNRNKAAKKVFDGLPPSRQKEIVRYIANLKTAESVSRNVEKAIGFLVGRNGFIGREKP